MTSNTLHHQASQAHLDDLRRWISENPSQRRTENKVRRLFASLLQKPAQAFRTSPSVS
jgi:hypothetical protein